MVGERARYAVPRLLAEIILAAFCGFCAFLRLRNPCVSVCIRVYPCESVATAALDEWVGGIVNSLHSTAIFVATAFPPWSAQAIV